MSRKARVARGLRELVSRGVDPHVAFRPEFLAQLRAHGLLDAPPPRPGGFAAVVRRAARLAAAGARFGTLRRRHGAVLFERRAGGDAVTTLAEGFNHAPGGVQRHAEVHCLLQLPRLEDAQGKELVVVELADVGPSLLWAPPCSRGCEQLLRRFGLARAHFTDGAGGIDSRSFRHEPGLDVPSATFASGSRLAGDLVSRQAWADVLWKLAEESQGRPPWSMEALLARAPSAEGLPKTLAWRGRLGERAVSAFFGAEAGPWPRARATGCSIRPDAMSASISERTDSTRSEKRSAGVYGRRSSARAPIDARPCSAQITRPA